MSNLFICGTPIGNLDDISYRTLETLNRVDYIYAEDTRHSIKLLNYFDINTDLKSYHKYNKESSGKEIMDLLKKDYKIALITDAGMPGISDPGSEIIKQVIKEEIPFEIIPGPTAFVMALIQSGFSTERFAFEGFLSRKRTEKLAHLNKIKEDDRTLIFYEAPHRLQKTLKTMVEVFGDDRQVSISREITKKFEETLRFKLKEAVNYFEDHKPRGEFVIVVEGNPIVEEITFDCSIKEHIIQLMDNGYTKKDAIKEVARLRDISKRDVYKESFDIEPNY